MCNCNKSDKNQTTKDVFDFLDKNGNQSSIGIGLFLIPAPEMGILEYKIVAVDGLSYIETAKRGQMCEAFQFVPTGISVYTNGDRTSSVTIQRIDDLKNVKCAEHCAGGCGTGCVCLTWSGVCYHP